MKIHIVQKGDTLSKIAKSYDVDYKDLVKHNPQIANPDVIAPGMKLTIPQQSKKIYQRKEWKLRDNIKGNNPKEIRVPIKKDIQPDKKEKSQTDEEVRRPIGVSLVDDGKPNYMHEKMTEGTHATMNRSEYRPKHMGSNDNLLIRHQEENRSNPYKDGNKSILCGCCHRPMTIHEEQKENKQEPQHTSHSNPMMMRGTRKWPATNPFQHGQ